MLDAVDEGGSIFYPGRTWVSDNKQMSRGMVTMHKERNCPKCLGSQKTDSFDMIISGWGGEAAHVNWGKKAPRNVSKQPSMLSTVSKTNLKLTRVMSYSAFCIRV